MTLQWAKFTSNPLSMHCKDQIWREAALPRPSWGRPALVSSRGEACRSRWPEKRPSRRRACLFSSRRLRRHPRAKRDSALAQAEPISATSWAHQRAPIAALFASCSACRVETKLSIVHILAAVVAAGLGRARMACRTRRGRQSCREGASKSPSPAVAASARLFKVLLATCSAGFPTIAMRMRHLASPALLATVFRHKALDVVPYCGYQSRIQALLESA
mmetsp:Transcript_12409/g.31589  ORF Transcript_12409/g.31589 Transcript_12409/m.31589 type:complete len:218 (+) Transcript_12409:370-1023(+)